jgi:pantetheine-phosphate adenylyltransferase
MSQVAVGGTFNPLHDGHKALLMKAVDLSRGSALLIGLTSDEMARKKTLVVDDYQSRYNEVMTFVQAHGVLPQIIKLNDPYGPTISDDFDYLVVSPETYPVGLKINMIRSEKNLNQLKIVLVDYVLAEDGLPISSTRIRKGEIDNHGKVLKDIKRTGKDTCELELR